MEDNSSAKIIKIDEVSHNLGGNPDTEIGWREEALAVIRDIEKHVKFISVSENIKSDAKKIFLNITTYEDKKLTVQLDYMGFRIVCDDKHDILEEKLKEQSVEQFSGVNVSADTQPLYFETPYALLSSVSEGYNKSFSDILINKLNNLQS